MHLCFQMFGNLDAHEAQVCYASGDGSGGETWVTSHPPF